MQNGEVSEAREAPAMVGDNGFNLSIRVVRSWSMGLGPMCTIAIAQSIVTPLLCLGWEPICVALD